MYLIIAVDIPDRKRKTSFTDVIVNAYSNITFEYENGTSQKQKHANCITA